MHDFFVILCHFSLYIWFLGPLPTHQHGNMMNGNMMNELCPQCPHCLLLSNLAQLLQTAYSSSYFVFLLSCCLLFPPALLSILKTFAFYDVPKVGQLQFCHFCFMHARVWVILVLVSNDTSLFLEILLNSYLLLFQVSAFSWFPGYCILLNWWLN